MALRFAAAHLLLLLLFLRSSSLSFHPSAHRYAIIRGPTPCSVFPSVGSGALRSRSSGGDDDDDDGNDPPPPDTSFFKRALLTMSRLSLVDYGIRSGVFDRFSPSEEENGGLAVTGIRPMDAEGEEGGKGGNTTVLGRAELEAVRALMAIFEGERVRALKIIEGGGE